MHNEGLSEYLLFSTTACMLFLASALRVFDVNTQAIRASFLCPLTNCKMIRLNCNCSTCQ